MKWEQNMRDDRNGGRSQSEESGHGIIESMKGAGVGK